jgi:hypothetical protein
VRSVSRARLQTRAREDERRFAIDLGRDCAYRRGGDIAFFVMILICFEMELLAEGGIERDFQRAQFVLRAVIGRTTGKSANWLEIAGCCDRADRNQIRGINEPVLCLYASYSGNVASMSDSSCRMRLEKAARSRMAATRAATVARKSEQLPTNTNQAPV